MGYKSYKFGVNDSKPMLRIYNFYVTMLQNSYLDILLHIVLHILNANADVTRNVGLFLKVGTVVVEKRYSYRHGENIAATS